MEPAEWRGFLFSDGGRSSADPVVSCAEPMPQMKLGSPGQLGDTFGSICPPEAGLDRHQDEEALTLLACVCWGNVLSSRPWALQGWGRVSTLLSLPPCPFSPPMSPFCFC